MGENVQEKKSDEKCVIGFLPSPEIRQSEMSFVRSILQECEIC